MTTEVYKFKKGDRIVLDQIYAIQGLADGDWWGRAPSGKNQYETDLNEDLIIVCDIEIKITTKRGSK